MKKLLAALVYLICFTGCERNINLSVNEQASKLVVDAEIYEGRPPQVVLTNSFGYFGEINTNLLTTLFERNARVTISNGSLTHTLKETPIPLGGGNFAYFYTLDPANPSTHFVGEHGKTYTLQITTQGGTNYTATTSIPIHTKTLDSLWWRVAPNQQDTTNLNVFGRFTDPPGFGNYIRYFMKVNKGEFLPGFTSVFDDQFVDGTQYNVQLPKGFDKRLPLDSLRVTEEDFFKRGDTVQVMLNNIDKRTFDFWRTWEFNYASAGSPFATPIVVQNNVPGALGNFSGYSVQVRTLIIPR
jgi:hypothetical protein